MKPILLAAFLASLGSAAMAEPALGLWKTQPDDNGNFGHVQVVACGAAICGTLVKAFDGAGKEIKSDNVGRQIITNMKNDGGGAYSGGKIYSPDRGKTYNGKLALSGNSMAVSGCVLGICRNGGTWARLK